MAEEDLQDTKDDKDYDHPVDDRTEYENLPKYHEEYNEIYPNKEHYAILQQSYLNIKTLPLQTNHLDKTAYGPQQIQKRFGNAVYDKNFKDFINNAFPGKIFEDYNYAPYKNA